MFTKLLVQMQMFIEDRKGVTAIEYAIVAVAIAGIVAIAFGEDTGLGAAFTTAMENISAAVSGEEAAATTP